MRRAVIALLLLISLSGCSSAAMKGTVREPAPEPTKPSMSVPPVPHEADPADAKWARRADIPTARSHMATTAAGGMIYVIGGLDRNGSLATVERYDPAIDQWEKLPDLPEAVNHPQAATVGGTVYVFGGAITYGTDGLANAWRFDPATGSWHEIAPMPGPKVAGAAVVLNGLIYVFGGMTDSNKVYVYDPRQDRWRTVADLPTARDHLVAVPYNGRIWAMSGKSSTVSEVYDPAKDTWEKQPDLPYGFGDAGAVVLGEEIWVVERQVTVGNGTTWRAGPRLPDPVYGPAVAAVDNSMYVASGVTQSGNLTNGFYSLSPQ